MGGIQRLRDLTDGVWGRSNVGYCEDIFIKYNQCTNKTVYVKKRYKPKTIMINDRMFKYRTDLLNCTSISILYEKSLFIIVNNVKLCWTMCMS